MEYINGWSIYPCEGAFRGAKDLGTDSFGTRKRKTFRGESADAVKKKIDKYEFEVATGLYIEPNKDTLIGFLKKYHTVCAGCDMWRPNYVHPGKGKAKWEETTSELYKMYIDVHFEPYFKQLKLTKVNTLVLDEFYYNKKTQPRKTTIIVEGKPTEKSVEPLSINSVIKLNKFLSAAFNYAVENDIMRKNPTKGTQLSGPIKYEPNIYDKEKFLKLMDAVYNTDDEIPIVFGAGCGLRRGEICGAAWEDVDFEECTIKISNTRVRFLKTIEKGPKNKTSKRKMSVPAYVIDALKRNYEAKGSPDKSEKIVTRWKPDSLSKRFKNLLETHGLDPIRLHDLKHFNAVIMMQSNISDKVAAKRLGHANVQMLHKVYQHVTDDIDRATAAIINTETMPKPVLNDDERRKSFKIVAND